ncbi:MAG: TlpA disulfide reductase family protein [Alistipes sp.]
MRSLVVLWLCIATACSTPIPEQRADKVVIICNSKKVSTSWVDFSEAGASGSRVGTSSPVFTFNSCHPEEQPPSFRTVETDTLVIPLKGDYMVVHYRYNLMSYSDFIAFNGDTVVIRNDSLWLTPQISIRNRQTKAYDLTYAEASVARYGLTEGFLAVDHFMHPWILRFISWKKHNNNKTVDQIRAELQGVVRQNLTDEQHWLDSLSSHDLLSAETYDYFAEQNRWKQRQVEYHLHKSSKADLRDTLAAGYHDSLWQTDRYGFYRAFYYKIAHAYYFDKAIPIFQGSIFDYKYIYERLQTDTLVRRKLQNELFLDCLNGMVQEWPIPDSKIYFDRILQQATDTAFLRTLHKCYDSLYTTTSQTRDSLLLSDRQGRKTTFEEVLKKHVGKIIYVDFWSSWCHPCCEGMPAAKKLRTKYKQKEVVFIYLSFDKDRETLLNGVTKVGLEDAAEVYLILNPKASKMLSTLKIPPIPRLLLYDRTGNLLMADAPRPESAAIVPLLDRYLP